MPVDSRLESIFHAWFDYDHATEEEAKIHARETRASLIRNELDRHQIKAEIADFLHNYRDRYREWVIRRSGTVSKRRF
jgi:hypothetical protein